MLHCPAAHPFFCAASLLACQKFIFFNWKHGPPTRPALLLVLSLGWRLGLSLPFAFTQLLPSLLHSHHALLSCYKRWSKKVSNLKIHRWFCSHCLWQKQIKSGLMNWNMQPLLWKQKSSRWEPNWKPLAIAQQMQMLLLHYHDGANSVTNSAFHFGSGYRYCCNLSVDIALIMWFTTNGMCAINNNIYTWREQAIIEWSWHVNSTVACCHVRSFAHMPLGLFWSQQNGAVTRMWRSCCVKPSQKECAIGALHCEKEGCNLSGGVALIMWFTTNKICVKNNNIYMWREQAIIEWSWHVNTVRSFAHMPLGLFWCKQYACGSWYLKP